VRKVREHAGSNPKLVTPRAEDSSGKTRAYGDILSENFDDVKDSFARAKSHFIQPLLDTDIAPRVIYSNSSTISSSKTACSSLMTRLSIL